MLAKPLISIQTRPKGFRGPTFFCFVLFSVIIPVFSPASADDLVSAPEDELCGRIEQIRQKQGLVIGNDGISATQLIPEFYERHNHTLAWRSKTNMEELLALIEASREEGLIPEDYQLSSLQEMLAAFQAGAMSPCSRGDFDILLTDALIRLGYHYLYGKVDPNQLDSNWNLKREILGRDPVAVLHDAISAESLSSFLQKLAPSSPLYDQMKKALAHYRDIQIQGGWPYVPEGPSLKKGMQNERIAILRQRLAITGDLAGTSNTISDRFDDEMEQAVMSFQKRHILEADGVVGKSTVAAMNVPVADRIDQIRVNMERARWVYRNLPEEFLVTDIAGFKTAIFKNRKIIWESTVQVGKPYRETPVFRDTMEYLVINPTWTVPPTILKNDILPRLRNDAEYLKKKNMGVIDKSGKRIDAATIDWANIKSFPYMLRQEPGPTNALGQIKFMFPNKHAVYLHDTPHKSGFNRAERAFSSGCIRVKKPLELAEILLNDAENWSQDHIRKVIDSKETRTVRLKKQMPVFLLYWTVGIRDGQLFFKPDVYSRDGKVLAALDGKFRLVAPEKMPDWYKK